MNFWQSLIKDQMLGCIRIEEGVFGHLCGVAFKGHQSRTLSVDFFFCFFIFLFSFSVAVTRRHPICDLYLIWLLDGRGIQFIPSEFLSSNIRLTRWRHAATYFVVKENTENVNK